MSVTFDVRPRRIAPREQRWQTKAANFASLESGRDGAIGRRYRNQLGDVGGGHHVVSMAWPFPGRDDHGQDNAMYVALRWLQRDPR